MATLEKLKVSSNHWDTDKNPSGFFNYLDNNEAMIVSMKGEPELCEGVLLVVLALSSGHYPIGGLVHQHERQHPEAAHRPHVPRGIV